MNALWYGLHRGVLCRIRPGRRGGLLCEAWHQGVWKPGPDFTQTDFKGRALSEAEARAWIRERFRRKHLGSPAAG